MDSTKKIYFASDFHLGAPTHAKSREREDRIVRWLDEIKKDADEIFLVGDLFDFWFEYKTVVPKGYVRFLGKLAELSDSGIKINVFTGNHDMWLFDYLEQELNIEIIRAPKTYHWNGKKVLVGHGDGLGPGDYSYKFLKAFFDSKICQWLFARIHPNLGIGIANAWSKKSRASQGDKYEKYLGDDKEWLLLYCQELLQQEHFDYFIFGHRHLPIEKQINNSKYINLGEWIKHNTYAVFDGESFSLKNFKD